MKKHNEKKDCDDTITFMLDQLKRAFIPPKILILPDNTKIKNDKKEIRKYIMRKK